AYAMAIGLLAVVYEAFRWQSVRRAGKEYSARKSLLGLWPFATAFLLLLSLFQPAGLWLPTERIEITGATKPLVGYVLRDSGEWFTFIADSDRILMRIRAKDVSSRVVCERQGAGSGTWVGEPWARVRGVRSGVLPACLGPP
ncbi:MAG: hypothetical protein QOE58_1943, partial [Actinomycetota bacterium]|nr:hypothetical protein [Actinomycetota bacterium]